MPQALGFCLFVTAIGHCAIAWSQDMIKSVQLPGPDAQTTRLRMQRLFPDVPEADAPPFVAKIITRTIALLDGKHDSLLDVPLDMEGVASFNQRVYEISRAIPPGQTMTYGEIARMMGDIGLARAVGQALGNNPFAPIVPCHRILAAGGRGGGFSAPGGVDTKLRMLEIEKAQVNGPGLFD